MPPVTDNRTRIVDAAAKILQQQGADALTTRAVADAAGVQPPAIYRLFGDKDGLLDAVAEHVMATYVAAKTDTVLAAKTGDVDPLDDLRAGWQTYIDFNLANPALFPLLNDPVRAGRSPATQSGRQVLTERVHRLARAGRLRVSEARAVEMIHSAGAGTVSTLLSTQPELRDRSLADDMFEAVMARIGTKAQARAQSTPRSHAIALQAAVGEFETLSGAERALLSEWLDRIVG